MQAEHPTAPAGNPAGTQTSGAGTPTQAGRRHPGRQNLQAGAIQRTGRQAGIQAGDPDPETHLENGRISRNPTAEFIKIQTQRVYKAAGSRPRQCRKSRIYISKAESRQACTQAGRYRA